MTPSRLPQGPQDDLAFAVGEGGPRLAACRPVGVGGRLRPGTPAPAARSPVDTITARSMTFSSSRMLPGQCHSCSAAIVDAGMVVIVPLGARGELLHEVADQQRDVLLAFAQRRHLDREHVQAVEQVAAERALVHHLLRDRGWSRRSAGRRRAGSACCRAARTRAPAATRSSFGCTSSGMSPISSRNSVPRCASSMRPILLVDRAGERAALVAEQLALEQRRGSAATLTPHERALLPRAQLVERAREQFLAGAGFAEDQHRGVGRRDRLDLLQHPLDRRAARR